MPTLPPYLVHHSLSLSLSASVLWGGQEYRGFTRKPKAKNLQQPITEHRQSYITFGVKTDRTDRCHKVQLSGEQQNKYSISSLLQVSCRGVCVSVANGSRAPAVTIFLLFTALTSLKAVVCVCVVTWHTRALYTNHFLHRTAEIKTQETTCDQMATRCRVVCKATNVQNCNIFSIAY